MANVIIVIVESGLLAVVNFLALFGNISLFVVILRKPALRTQTNMFLLNLAAADLLVSVVNMPLTNATLLHGSWMFGEFVCELTAFLNLLSLVASVMSLAMVSVNRYHYIVKWRTYQKHFGRRRCAVYIVLVWVFSGVMCLPPLFGWAEYRFIVGQSQCFVHWSSSSSYTFGMVGVCLCGPVSVMATCYWKIWKTSDASDKNVSTWVKGHNSNKKQLDKPREKSNALKMFKSSNDLRVHPHLVTEHKDTVMVSAGVTSLQNTPSGSDLDTVDTTEKSPSDYNIADDTRRPEENTSTREENSSQCKVKSQFQRRIFHTSKRSRKETKLTRTLFIIIAVFCLCWTPYAVTIILELFISSPIPHAASFGVLLLGYSNSVLNVVIYVSLSGVVRKEFRKTFNCSCSCDRQT